MALTPQLLPSGFLHTSGNQIVDANGNPVRLASLGIYVEWGMFSADYQVILNNIKAAGFNSIRMMWTNITFRRGDSYPSWFINFSLGANATLSGLNINQVQQRWVAYCRVIGLKVIFDNHVSSNWGLGQQANGLWYDLGGVSDNTDGGGVAGTTTDAQWVQDWANFAAQYAGNDTVIGYDLRNEPFGNGVCTWEAGSNNPNRNIRWAYERAANAIFARVGNGPLIICEPVANDALVLQTLPVTPSVSNKLVYSTHPYPALTAGSQAIPDSGTGAIDRYTQQWGGVVKANFAPVWLGEIGDFMSYTDASATAEAQAWANTLISYVNGTAPGGPTFSGSQQGISCCWWDCMDGDSISGDTATKIPTYGIFRDIAAGTLHPAQQAVYSQFLYYGPGSGGNPGGTGGTASPNGTTVTTVGPAITDANHNLWTITAGAQIAVNGVTDPTTGNVIELAYVSGLIWQLNTFGDWYSKAAPTDTWVGPTKTSPLGGAGPVASPDGTVLNATGQAIIDANGNAWSLVNSTGPQNRIGAPIAGVTVTTGTWTHGTVAGQDYALLLPYGYDSTHIYPVVMALHGNQLANSWYISSGASTSADSVRSFLNSVGINTHLENSASVEYLSGSVALSLLGYLGIDQVRQIIFSDASPNQPMQSACNALAQGGMQFHWLTQFAFAQTLDVCMANLATFAQQFPSASVSYEGLNEVNSPDWPATYPPGSANDVPTSTRLYQQAMWSTIKGNATTSSIKVYSYTVNIGIAGYAAFISSVGDVSAYCDYPAAHLYPQEERDAWDTNSVWTYPTLGPPQWAIAPSKVVNGVGVVTETGWQSNTPTWAGVDEATQAKLCLNLYISNWAHGIPFTAIYDLTEQSGGADGNWGLFHSDKTPKPAATALRNFTTILKSLGVQGATGTLPNVTITNQPSDTFVKVLRGANGFYAVIWRQAYKWDINNMLPVTPAAISITVNLGQNWSAVSLYDPLTGTNPTQNFGAASSATFQIVDHALILALVPTSASDPDTVVSGEGGYWNNVAFRTRYPAIVVMPYCDQRADATGLVVNFGGYTKADQFSEGANVALLEFLFSNYSCDRSRVYVTGTGTGGQGAWGHMIKYGVRAGQKALRRYFAAAAPMDGWSIEWLASDSTLVAQLHNDPIWAWNGDQDANSAPFDQSWYAAFGGVTPYNGTKAPNGQMKFTQVTGAAGSGRASGYTLTGTGNALFDWMFAQSLDTLASLPGSSVAVNGTIDPTTSGGTSTGATLLFADEFGTFTGATNGNSARNDWVPHYAFGGSERTLSANNEAEAYVDPSVNPHINPFSIQGGALKITCSAAASTGANDLGLPYNSGAMVSCLELNGSPVYSAPSSSARIVLAGSGGTITDSLGAVWSISTGLAVLRNGVAAGFTANVAQIAYVGTTMWHQNTSGSWYSWDGVSTWNPGNNPVSQQGLFARQYGFFAAMMLLPRGRGYWPAWWLEPVDGGVGEIDIMEWLGHDTTTYYFSLHFQDGAGNNIGSGDAITCSDASVNWHEFAINWQPDFITAYLDRRQVMQRATPSFMKKPYYMLTNLAMGAAGSWPGPPDGSTQIPNSMLIDSIRVYDKFPGPFTQSTSSAVELAFVSNKLWYLDSKGLWRSKTLPTDQWLPVAGTTTAPIVTSGGGPTPTPQATSWNLLTGITNWAASQAVTLGTRRSNNGLAYQVVVPGTTAATGGPTGTGSNIVDGTARWKYIGNADYVTLAGAVASLPATFTTDIAVSIWNQGALTTTAATPILSLAGHNTGSNKLTVGCAAGESIRDSLLSQSIPLYSNAGRGVALQLPLAPSAAINYVEIGDPTVEMNGLQFIDPQPDSGSSIIHASSTCTKLTVRNCVIDGFAQLGGAFILDLDAVSITFTNCLIIDRQPSNGTAHCISIDGATCTSARFVNCTFVAINAPSGGNLFLAANGFAAGVIKNCAIFGYNTICSSSGFTFDHCAISNAGLGSGVDGGSNLLNKTASAQFINAQTDFRTLATSVLVDAGVPSLTDIPSADDIAGTPRPGGPLWDIGCWERESFSIRDVRPPPISIW